MENLHSIYKHQFIDAIRELQEEGSKFKMHLFGIIMQDKSANVSKINEYKGYVEEFLNFWEEYGTECQKQAKNVICSSQVETISQDVVRDYLYASYDYASILPFVDGIAKGIKDGNMTKGSDIEDFFNCTTSKAFKNIGQGVGGCIDNVTNLNGEKNPANNKMFNTLKNAKLTDPKDKYELLSSIKNTIKFLIDPSSWNTPEMNSIDDTLKIQMINYIVEYITYSISAYACRIYVVSTFYWSFIDSCDKDVIAKFHEAVGETSVEFDNPTIEIMQLTDEAKCKDYNSLQEFENNFSKFLKSIHANIEPNPHKEDLATIDGITFDYKFGNDTTDVFSNTLGGNSIYQLIIDLRRMDVYSTSGVEELEKINDLIRSELTGHNQVYFAKKEFFNVISNTNPKNKSVNALKELAGDLYKFTFHCLFHIFRAINKSKSQGRIEGTNPDYSPYVLGLINNINKLLIELYKEISVACLYKAREIEMQINELNNAQMLNTINDIEINVPGNEKKINDTLTEEAEFDILMAYGLPQFEYLEMYREYVNSITGGTVFTEADNNRVTLLNKIVAFISSIFSKIANFFSSTMVKNCVTWVEKNKETLEKATFTNEDKMQVIPFKTQFNISFDNVINNLNNYPKEYDENKFNQWKQSLYPSKELYDLFAVENMDKNERNLRFQYYITCGKNPTEQYDVNNFKQEISGVQISQQMNKVWIPILLGFSKIADQLKNESSKLTQAIKSFSASINNLQNTNKPASGNNESSEKKEDNATPSMNAESVSFTEDGDNTNNNESLINHLLTTANEVAMNLTGDALLKMNINTCKTLYGYITTAHGMIKSKSEQQTTNESYDDIDLLDSEIVVEDTESDFFQ